MEASVPGSGPTDLGMAHAKGPRSVRFAGKAAAAWQDAQPHLLASASEATTVTAAPPVAATTCQPGTVSVQPGNVILPSTGSLVDKTSHHEASVMFSVATAVVAPVATASGGPTFPYEAASEITATEQAVFGVAASPVRGGLQTAATPIRDLPNFGALATADASNDAQTTVTVNDLEPEAVTEPALHSKSEASDAVIATGRPRRGRKALQPRNSGVAVTAADAPVEHGCPQPPVSPAVCEGAAQQAAMNTLVDATISSDREAAAAAAGSDTEEDIDVEAESRQPHQATAKKRSRPGAGDSEESSIRKSSLPWTDSESDPEPLNLQDLELTKVEAEAAEAARARSKRRRLEKAAVLERSQALVAAATAATEEGLPEVDTGGLEAVGAAAQAAAPIVTHKTCWKCSETKPVSDFYRSKAALDGFDGRCKMCDRLIKQERTRERATLPTIVVTHKQCQTCDEVKPADQFSRRAVSRDGLKHKCKECMRTKRVRPPPAINPAEAPTKVCLRCLVEKPRDAFWKTRRVSDGLHGHCKDCIRAAQAARLAHLPALSEATCHACRQTLPVDHFHKNRMASNGLQPFCKACAANKAAQMSRLKLHWELQSLHGATSSAAATAIGNSSAVGIADSQGFAANVPPPKAPTASLHVTGAGLVDLSSAVAHSAAQGALEANVTAATASTAVVASANEVIPAAPLTNELPSLADSLASIAVLPLQPPFSAANAAPFSSAVFPTAAVGANLSLSLPQPPLQQHLSQVASAGSSVAGDTSMMLPQQPLQVQAMQQLSPVSYAAAVDVSTMLPQQPLTQLHPLPPQPLQHLPILQQVPPVGFSAAVIAAAAGLDLSGALPPISPAADVLFPNVPPLAATHSLGEVLSDVAQQQHQLQPIGDAGTNMALLQSQSVGEALSDATNRHPLPQPVEEELSDQVHLQSRHVGDALPDLAQPQSLPVSNASAAAAGWNETRQMRHDMQ